MGGGINRSQGKDLASQLAARQDRNTFLEGGGSWSWDDGTDTLAWSATFYVRTGGITTHSITTNSVVLSSAGDGAYITLDRASGGAASVSTRALDSAANDDDDVFFIAVRGSDNRIYLFDGTILTDGDSKTLGTGVSATDRGNVTADGAAAQTVPFSYATGTDQLQVFVGGILQRLSVDYVETDTTTVTFQSGHIPSNGEVITFLNVVGGQGPAGTGVADLQEAYDANQDVDTSTNGPIRVYGSTPANPVFQGGTGGPSDYDHFEVYAAGDAKVTDKVLLVPTGGSLTDAWYIKNEGGDLVFYHNNTGKAVRIPSTGGLEHGAWSSGFTGGGELKWTEYTGTFSSTGVTSIATGIAAADIKGVALIATSALGRDVLFEMLSAPGSASDRLVVTQSGGTIRFSATAAAAAAVGVNFQGQVYTLIVFHE